MGTTMVSSLAGLLLACSAVVQAAPVGPSVLPYGFLKMDASWDDSRMSAGNYARWVEAEDANKNDSEFNLTARHTRLGLRISGPEYGGMQTSGLVEADFYGGGTENKPTPMMRHAWMEVSWPAWDFTLLGGQTSDLTGPLEPPIVDSNSLRSGGNIGYRHPQFRLTKGIKAGGVRIETAFAAMRDVAVGGTWFTGDAGADAGFPFGMARVGLSLPGWTKQDVVVGVSCSLGQEEWDRSKAGQPRIFRSWSGVVDLNLPILETLSLRGEGWMGENLQTYGAGILQGISFQRWKTIRARGGWLALSAGPFKFWKYSLGTGVDRVDANDLGAGTDRKCNQSAFGTVTYEITKKASVALECYGFITEYRDPKKNAEALRMAASLIHRF